jgi:hydroxyacylglutathione hydrolase
MSRVPAARLLAVLAMAVVTVGAQGLPAKWIHGSAPCAENTDPPFQVHAYDEDTFVLRENKCINYEGPFLYLLFGRDKVFLQDTGAAPRNPDIIFPVAGTVQRVINEWAKKHGRPAPPLIVTHSHAHGDHIGGDKQFQGMPTMTVVGTTAGDVQTFFGFEDWPNRPVTLDLGGRVLDILPIPGHEPSSIAVYDRRTKILLTGDTVYPGRLYIRDWPAYRASIARLAAFVLSHDVSLVLGTHIEMTSKPGIDYPTGTVYQPDEHELALEPRQIAELNAALQKMTTGPVREVHDHFIIDPR